MSVSFRGENEEQEKFVLNSMKHPSNEEMDNNPNINLEEFYSQNKNGENNEINPEINTGYKDAYLSFMGKLTQNCTF